MDQIHYISGRIFISHELLKYKLSNIILVIGAGDRWRWRSSSRDTVTCQSTILLSNIFIFNRSHLQRIYYQRFLLQRFYLKGSPQNNFQGFYSQTF